MNLKNLIQNLTGRRRKEPELSEELIKRLIGSLEHTYEEELTCEEVFALVDEYAEAELRGEDVTHLKPLLRHHLDMCQECNEQYLALLQVLEGTKS